jgi:hypothetical protein
MSDRGQHLLSDLSCDPRVERPARESLPCDPEHQNYQPPLALPFALRQVGCQSQALPSGPSRCHPSVLFYVVLQRERRLAQALLPFDRGQQRPSVPPSAALQGEHRLQQQFVFQPQDQLWGMDPSPDLPCPATLGLCYVRRQVQALA